MLRLSKRAALIVALAVLAAVVIAIAFLGPDYPVCEYTAEYAYKNCSPQNVELIAVRQLGELLRDSAFVTALATIAIAWFTWTLGTSTKKMWVETKKAAEAAMESADALVTVESARLFIFPKSHNLWTVAAKYGFFYKNSPGMGKLTGTVAAYFCFKNYGKTPAIMKEASIALIRSETPPESIEGFNPMIELPVERVISTGHETEQLSVALQDVLDMNDAIAIADGSLSIWLLGYVTYDDVFDRECTQRFLYKLSPKSEDVFIRYYDKSAYRKA